MLIDKNIQILSKNSRHWFASADKSANLYPKFIISENKTIDYFQDENNQVLLVEDTYDEKNQINPNKKEVIFIFGLNSIQEIRQVIRNKNKNSIVLIIEPQLTFFQHALSNKNLDFFKDEKVFLFADHQIENITEFLRMIILDINLIGLFKNIVIYLNHYYRNNDFELTKNIIVLIQQYIQSATIAIGNDVHDSIQGLDQNLNNLKYLSKAKNPFYLKDKFKNKPAVMVAAGPSLNKNIHFLKQYQNKVIVIAVDTILQRLIIEGITPHFVCSVERIQEVYDYFYKDKYIPQQVTLVGPLLLDSRIFEGFKGEYIIPFRTEVTEYRWLQSMLNIEDDISMPVGLSCAHMAFGVAQHLGCSPIIMIGQDLAYDTVTGDTHVSGTYDDKKNKTVNHTADEDVLGYDGTYVKTTKIWNTFRHWFESQILNNNLNVINATEGGAKIHHADQMPLQEALEKYTSVEVINIHNIIKSSPNYNFNINTSIDNIETEIKYIQDEKERCKLYFETIRKLHINHENFKKNKFKYNTEFEKVHILISEIFKHQLLMHNLQPLIVTFLWEYNSIEEILSVENLKRKKTIVGRFVAAITVAIDKVENSLIKGVTSIFSKNF